MQYHLAASDDTIILYSRFSRSSIMDPIRTSLSP